MPINYKNYPHNWELIRKAVLHRAKNRCELCNAENYKPHWKTGSRVVLTIHHIIRNLKDNRPQNLICLCQRCHLRLDLPFKVKKKNNEKDKYHLTKYVKLFIMLVVVVATIFTDTKPSLRATTLGDGFNFIGDNMPSGIYKHKKGYNFSKKWRDNLSKSHIGQRGYWTGKKRSPEDIEKMRKSHLGEKQTKERILKRIKRGPEHYNWQGGITPTTRKRLRGTFWRQIADEIREKHNNTCFVCEKKGGNKKLPVHHLIPFRITRDNNFYNLIVLCQSCHIKIEQRCHNKLDMPLRIRNRQKSKEARYGKVSADL